MIRILIGSLMLAGAAFSLLKALRKRYSGSQDFGRWRRGGKIAFTEHVAGCTFLALIGAGFLCDSAIWVIPAIPVWLVGYVLQNRANHRHQREEEELRTRNALDHPGVFDNPPPYDLDSFADERFDLYDAGACTWIGTVSKSDMRVVIDDTVELQEQGPNDIYVFPGSLSRAEPRLSHEFVTLLNDAFANREYLVLRWIPRSQDAK